MMGHLPWSEIFHAQCVARKLLKAKRYQKPKKYEPVKRCRDLMNHKDIAAELGLTQQRVQQIEKDILKMLREGYQLGDPRLLALKDFLHNDN